MDELEKKIQNALEEKGGKASSARMGEEKQWYCARCDEFVQVTITAMGVPRHSCGRQLRPAWRDDFVPVKDEDND